LPFFCATDRAHPPSWSCSTGFGVGAIFDFFRAGHVRQDVWCA
jgi:hypothetical protein